MPESVKQCVTSTMEDENVSESEAYAICWSRFNDGELKEDEDYEWGPEDNEDDDVESEDTKDVNSDKEKLHRKAEEINNEYDEIDSEGAYAVSFVTLAAEKAGFGDELAVQAVAYKTVTGEWPGVHPSESLHKGRTHLIKTYKYVVKKILGQGEIAKTLSKSDTMEKINFTADFAGTQTVFKSGDDFVIWGPASVEIVDKEGDRIKAKALEDALPQLLKRGRLSLEHSDQLVGKIIESFEIEEEVEIEIDGETYKRKDFPTDVLEHQGNAALFVCGKIYDDTRQSRRVRESIENGELNSYSISGEALVSRSKIENGEPVNDIVELDLSAVTVCEEGMNQDAKFATVAKDDSDSEMDRNILTVKSEKGQVAISKSDDAGGAESAEHSGERTITISKKRTMSDNNKEGEDNPTEITLDELTGEFQDVVKEALRDESFATENDVLGKEDVEEIAESIIHEKMDESQEESEEDVEKSAEEDSESGSLTKEEVEGIAQEVAKETASDAAERTAEEMLEVFKDEYEDDEEDEKSSDDEDEEDEKSSHDDEDEEDEKSSHDDDEDDEHEKDVEDGKQSEDDLAAAIADMTGADEDDALSAIEDLQNKDEYEDEDEDEKSSDDDEDEDEKSSDDEDEEDEKASDDDDEEEEKTGGSQYTVSELKEKLPEDVFDAVRGYIGEEKAEKSADEADDPMLSDIDIDTAVEKAISEKFDSASTPDSPTGSTEKSYDEEDFEGESETANNPALSLWR